jgi:hypothetical protein
MIPKVLLALPEEWSQKEWPSLGALAQAAKLPPMKRALARPGEEGHRQLKVAWESKRLLVESTARPQWQAHPQRRVAWEAPEQLRESMAASAQRVAARSDLQPERLRAAWEVAVSAEAPLKGAA